MSYCNCNCRPCNCRNYNSYGCLNFIGDMFMLCITGGIWFFWILFREIRKNRR